ncbi:hypothetical protein FOA52_003709 [Chlamydomonas sp. UWO 241]|nr:hypothetical protein FOA52_003709 [Chlamydomonas sp. UWO 241]
MSKDNMLRQIESYGAKLTESESKLAQTQEEHAAVVQQLEADLAKQAEAQAELDAQHSHNAGSGAERVRMEAEMQSVQAHNDELKQEVYEVLAAQEAVMEDGRVHADHFVQQCMALEATLQAALGAF